MRIGFNPHKDKPLEEEVFIHQVIIPVFIPNHEGYFKDSFQIFKLCIESVFKTVHNRTFITIVNNGSDNFVKEYLDQLYQQNKIHELIHTQNIGKLNAILKGISGNDFSLITIVDADVLFLDNWQEATYKIFETFPKTGAVCPTPSSRSLRTYTANVYWDFFFSSKIKFSEVVNPEALKQFAISLSDSNFYNKVQLQKYLTIERNTIKAVIGAGHFVTTYRAEVFCDLNDRYTNYKLGGDSESKLLDFPVVDKGYWRLSTDNNYAYHMGNVMEEWMNDELNKLEINEKEITFKLKEVKANSPVLSFVKNKIFGKFILNKKIMKIFIIWKGLTKREAENYLT